MTVLYILDANVLIDANRDYYPIERVPEFWDWLAEMGRLGRVKIPLEIYEEVVLPAPKPKRPDALVDWLKAHRDTLLLNEPVEVRLVAEVTDLAYADNLTEVEIEKVGRDPFLITYAIVGAPDRCVVTNERTVETEQNTRKSAPSRRQ